MPDAALTELPNIGTTLAARLDAIGITSREELAEMGPAQAYVRLSAEAGARLPLCYYLYSLEGALRDVDWRSLTANEKEGLRRRTGLMP